MNYWTTPPYKFDMNPATPVRTNLTGFVGGSYNVSNGAYDSNGNLLFSIVNTGVYGPTGSYCGKLGGYNLAGCDEAYTELSAEIAIVPIPGTCKQFYVIYAMDNPIGDCPLLYCKVDCSGTTPVVINHQNVWVYCPPDYVYTLEPEGYFIGGGGLDWTSFAVSKVYTGSGATEQRFLFFTSFYGIYRSYITSTGISQPELVADARTIGLSSADFEGYEAELSWGSNLFAWVSKPYSGSVGAVHTIGINPLSGDDVIGSLKNYSIAGAKGIEFTNSTGITPTLYVSRTGGISKINTSTDVITPVTIFSTGIDLSNTFLEYGKNGKIYGVSPTYSSGSLVATTLVGIASNDAITTVDAGFDSRYTYYVSPGIFTLPDQIDGENYTSNIVPPAISLAGFRINNITPSSSCANASNYYNCTAMNFTPVYSAGTPAQYKIEIKATDDNCNPITGTGYINYNPNGYWTSGQPAANLDLRTLTDASGLNLGNITGKVNVKYTVRDFCNNESTRNYKIQVSGAPAPGIVLEIYNSASPQNYLQPAHTINSAVNVGCYSPGYRISNSTGMISYYRVDIDEINSQSGAIITHVYDRTINIDGVSGLTLENLNSYCVSSAVWPVNPGIGACTVDGAIPDDDAPSTGYSGYTGYFGYNNGQYSMHRYFKLTVYVGNVCDEVSDYSYLHVTTYNKHQAFTVINDNEPFNTEIAEQGNIIIVFPNPATSTVTFEINCNSDTRYTLEFYDMYGRNVMKSAVNGLLFAGSNTKTCNISNLAPGTYTYLLITDNHTAKGLIIKQ